jgi:hypothetical protein
MQTVELTRDGGMSIPDRIAEMQRWLDQEGIRAINLRAVRMLRGRITFAATFEKTADADPFLQAFSD